MEIIPAIDIIDGKCVRLIQGDFRQKKTYHENPLEVAKSFADAGVKRLHLVDLDGAKSGHVVNRDILEKIASQTDLWIDFGGGVQSDRDIRVAFECGARQITGGSIAVKNKSLFQSWLETYGGGKIILGADVKNGKIAIGGWQTSTDISVIDFIADYKKLGIKTVISTDVSKDGLLQGPSYTLYEEIIQTFPNIELIASGGVSSLDDIEKLNNLKIAGVIIGKALYEGKIKLKELERFLISSEN